MFIIFKFELIKKRKQMQQQHNYAPTIYAKKKINKSKNLILTFTNAIFFFYNLNLIFLFSKSNNIEYITFNIKKFKSKNSNKSIQNLFE
jgi:hypothetical protein